MYEEKFDELWSSDCEKDYKKKHYWQSIGVVWNMKGGTFSIWRCSQCGKCISERLEFLTLREEQRE